MAFVVDVHDDCYQHFLQRHGIFFYYKRNSINIWRNKLDELLDDSDYLKVATNVFKTYFTKSVRAPLLQIMLSEKIHANNDQVKLKLLSEVKAKDRIEFAFSPAFLHYLNSGGKHDFKISAGNQTFPKFALLNFNEWEEIDASFASMFGKWMVSSGPRTMPMLQLSKVWIMLRNFFTRGFRSFLGAIGAVWILGVFRQANQKAAFVC